MSTKSIITMLMLLVFTGTSAKKNVSDDIKPQWIHKVPIPTNPTFNYEIITSTANSLDAARQKCLAELMSSSGLSQGVIITSDYNSKEKLSQQWVNGHLSEVVDYDAETKTTAKSKENEIFVENIDEYWSKDYNGIYYLTKLYAISKLDHRPKFDNIDLTTKYGVQGLWRSAIVPGWGQFYKGSTLKGGLILGGTVAFVGGIIYTENMRQDYMNKIKKTHNTDNIRAYKTKADNFATGRNICIGGVAALYVYNVIDAIVSPGARHIVVRKNVNGSGYALLPSITHDGNPAITAQITF